MPISYNRMKRLFLEGLLWLFLLPFGLTVLSLETGHFLDFDNLPDTNFTCVGKVIGGYYADLETNCQMFHVCTIGQADEPMDIRFLCLNGTVFDQETRVCERIDEVDCSKSEQFYSLNLELYGNSGPILEETPEVPQETESPSMIINPTTTSTTTTTTTKRPTTAKQTNSPYFTTIRPPSTTTVSADSHRNVAGHHFRVNNADIRFNPEEINISLNPGAPPDIRTKHYDSHHIYNSDNSKVLVAHNGDNDEEQSVRSSSTSPKSIIYTVDVGDGEGKLDDNFGFSDDFRGTEPPRHQQFLIQTNSFRHSQSFPPNSNQYHHPQFHSTTVKHHQQPSHTTARALYLHSLKPPQITQHQHYTHHPRTEKTPQRVQIPIPVLPTLPPLTFSTPAPFTLQRHIENKRYTKDHQAPPRIIISASASVSDASGRRLNYSLGTIGAAQILETPPSSYDEYKDGDVGLDPFYHDVPKVKQTKRRRRSVATAKLNPFEIIKNEKEAVEVLKFLFTWYQSHQATATVPPATSPATPDLIREINDELAVTSDSSATSAPSYGNSELFKKSGRFSIVGGYRNDNDKPRRKSDRASRRITAVHSRGLENASAAVIATSSDATATTLKGAKEPPFNPDDYVDDNYEGVVYNADEDNKRVDDEKGRFVDPHAVAELYKYFNVHSQLNRRTMHVAEADAKEIDNIATPFTKIDEHSGAPGGSSTTPPPPRHTVRRRGKQRTVDSYQEASFTSGLSKEQLPRNYISEHGSGRRGKGRTRSRLTTSTDASTFASESTTVLNLDKIATTPGVTTDDEDNFNLDYSPAFDTVTEAFSALNGTGQSADDVVEDLRELDNVTDNPEETNSTKDPAIENDSFTASPAAEEERSGATDPIHNNLKELAIDAGSVNKYESGRETSPQVTEEAALTDTTETSTATDVNTENSEETTTDNSKASENTDTITVESTTEPLRYNLEPISELVPVAPTTDSPSYLIKILRYYAESAMSSTEEPERVATSTSAATTTAYHEENSEERRQRQRNRQRHYSTTDLPTLRDIYEGTTTLSAGNTIQFDSDKISRYNLLQKLTLIEQTLADTTTHQPQTSSDTSDTTATSFEDPESFATTTPSQELTRTFEINMEEATTAPATAQNYNSFYDDLFVVPELTEKNVPESRTEQIPTAEATTPLPDVEIQKSISIPISVLETNSDVPNDGSRAQDINGLVSSERGDDEEKVSTVTTEETSTPTYLAETKVPVVQENATEIILLTNTGTLENGPSGTPLDMPGTINSSHLLQVSVETTREPITTTTSPLLYTRKSRPTRRRPNKGQRNQFGRHRFSTELFTKKPPPSDDNRHRKNITDAPLHRSVSPTRPELKKVSLHTTPLSSEHGYRAPNKVGKHYVFNCFGKETDRFYADPRDCRLFHYCTQGYSKNQLLDLKYVCDQKTFFDEDKLICTKVKPSRCL